MTKASPPPPFPREAFAEAVNAVHEGFAYLRQVSLMRVEGYPRPTLLCEPYPFNGTPHGVVINGTYLIAEGLSPLEAAALLAVCNVVVAQQEAHLDRLLEQSRLAWIDKLAEQQSKDTPPSLLPLVGLTESEACAWLDSNDKKRRVISVDGVGRICADNWKADRVNLTLVDGRVTKATIG